MVEESKNHNGVEPTSCWGPSNDAGQHQTETNTENCQICGSKLEYFDSGKQLTCFRCGKTDFANISCPNGHYICDECHGKDVFETIREFVMNSKLGNPFEIAEILMGYTDRVPMLGCENAWIAAGAFMAALKNQGTLKITNEQIDEALNRTRKQAIGGYCGLTGVCGITPAIGACFSVILGAACPKDQETALTMKVVGKVVNAIAGQTGPCCCKNFVRTALSVAVESATELLNVSLPWPVRDIVCSHVTRHPHGCRTEKCPYFKNIAPPIDNNVDVVDQNISKIDYLINKSLELGVDVVKVIDTNSIALADWVQWKCQYGCPFYDKDSLHPPLAPTAESARRVIKEYDKALLLNGSNGPQLSDKAVKIEHLAYATGFYKAFALLALPSGDNPGWTSGDSATLAESQKTKVNKDARPLMEAVGIDVFKTARDNGFHIDTKKETYGKWNYFALVLLE